MMFGCEDQNEKHSKCLEHNGSSMKLDAVASLRFYIFVNYKWVKTICTIYYIFIF